MTPQKRKIMFGAGGVKKESKRSKNFKLCKLKIFSIFGHLKPKSESGFMLPTVQLQA
jgi:hypothetical protein